MNNLKGELKMKYIEEVLHKGKEIVLNVSSFIKLKL